MWNITKTRKCQCDVGGQFENFQKIHLFYQKFLEIHFFYQASIRVKDEKCAEYEAEEEVDHEDVGSGVARKDEYL